MLPVLAVLAKAGLSILTGAIITKGKATIEDKLGIKLPETEAEVTPELTTKLLMLQNEHHQFLIAAETAASAEVSTRWVADMASDNKLSKNTRPGILIYLTILFSLVLLFNLDIKEAYIELLGQLLMIVFGAYFMGRSIEKSIDMSVKGKK